MKSKIETKICGVCGDKALGHNFNALSCESCKAFFRRNALTQKNFKCPFNNQCEITTITRRFCQKCRLDKCIAIGMCKDLIMSEEDKVAKRQKIQENRVKRQCNDGFKKGFKKMKKETVDVNSNSNEDGGVTYDSDSKDTPFVEKTCRETKTNQVTSVNEMEVAVYKSSTDEGISSSTERLVSSSDEVSDSNKLMTPLESRNGSQCSSESDTCALNDFVLNDLSCNHSTLSEGNYITSRNNADCYAQDVVSVVQR